MKSSEATQEMIMRFAEQRAIGWTEQGLVPDSIIRGGIRGCCGHGWPSCARMTSPTWPT